MARNLVCSECGGKFQIGFIPDWIGGGVVQHSWVEGKLERNIFGMLKRKGRKNYNVFAYRCQQCGLLKFYAGPDHSADKEE
jgi:hypothetical protein